MVQQKRKRTLIIAGAGLLLILVIIGTVLTIRAMNPSKADPYKQTETSDTKPTTETPKSDDKDEQKDVTSNDQPTSNQSSVDPASLSTIAIAPMNLEVAYVKGIGGFEYQVARTASGTQYVEFSSPELVGTKCTDDMGAFASIIESPSEGESSTLSKTTKVDGKTYGLALSSENCTKDPAQLKKYQTSFSDAFGQLKKIE